MGHAVVGKKWVVRFMERGESGSMVVSAADREAAEIVARAWVGSAAMCEVSERQPKEERIYGLV